MEIVEVEAPAVRVHHRLAAVGSHADGADLVGAVLGLAEHRRHPCLRPVAPVEPAEAVAQEPGLQRLVGPQHPRRIGLREGEPDPEPRQAQPVGLLPEGQAALGIRQLLGMVFEPVAPGGVLQEEPRQPRPRHPVPPEEGRGEGEGPRQVPDDVAQMRQPVVGGRAHMLQPDRLGQEPPAHGLDRQRQKDRRQRPRLVRRVIDLRHHRPEGDIRQPRRRLDLRGGHDPAPDIGAMAVDMIVEPGMQGLVVEDDVGHLPVQMPHVAAPERPVPAPEEIAMVALRRQEQPGALVAPRGQHQLAHREPPRPGPLQMQPQGGDPPPRDLQPRHRRPEGDAEVGAPGQRRRMDPLAAGVGGPAFEALEAEGPVRAHHRPDPGQRLGEDRIARVEEAAGLPEPGREGLRPDRPGGQGRAVLSPEPRPRRMVDGIEGQAAPAPEIRCAPEPPRHRGLRGVVVFRQQVLGLRQGPGRGGGRVPAALQHQHPDPPARQPQCQGEPDRTRPHHRHRRPEGREALEIRTFRDHSGLLRPRLRALLRMCGNPGQPPPDGAPTRARGLSGAFAPP